ncbi:MAG: hypothetical protein CVV17_08535, partial [Gammaproteobacteria bacterium HGW-Gammaproteobacteria-7]
GSDGFKLSDDQEAEIEALLDAETDDLPRPTGGDLGSITDYFEGGQKYLQYLKQTVDEEFDGIHVALDCAHGATSTLATHVFADLDADISSMGASPNGLNINDGVGSTHPEALAKMVKEKGADIGLAFDGDGDRVQMIAADGRLCDGDDLLYILASDWHASGRLRGPVVGTAMSNYGLEQVLAEREIGFMRARVGDRYVHQLLIEHGGGFAVGEAGVSHPIAAHEGNTGIKFSCIICGNHQGAGGDIGGGCGGSVDDTVVASIHVAQGDVAHVHTLARADVFVEIGGCATDGENIAGYAVVCVGDNRPGGAVIHLGHSRCGDGQRAGGDVGGHAGRLQQGVVTGIRAADAVATDNDGFAESNIFVGENTAAAAAQGNGVAAQSADRGRAAQGGGGGAVVYFVRCGNPGDCEVCAGNIGNGRGG